MGKTDNDVFQPGHGKDNDVSSAGYNMDNDVPHPGYKGHDLTKNTPDTSIIGVKTAISGSSSVSGIDGDSEVQLDRTIGLLGAIGLTIGSIIGSGIFVSPHGVVAATHSEALALIMWAVGGLAAMLATLGLAELACLIPRSFGEYNYLRITYAKWVGFLFAWSSCLMLAPGGLAIISMTSATYMLTPAYDDGCGDPPVFMVRMLAAAIILLLTASNSYSVIWSTRLNIVFMIAKIAALCIIIVGGIVRLIQGHTYNLATGFDGSNTNVGEVIIGFYSAMFAYIGWAMVVNVVEEIKRPNRNIPLTYYIAMPTITCLYVMANVSYFTVMDTSQLMESPAVAITWADTVMPNVPWLMPLCVALSTFGTCNGNIFGAGRTIYVMSREGEMPETLGMIHRRRKTPMPGIIFNSIFSLIYIMIGDISSLMNYLGFSTGFFMALVQISVIILRVKMKHAPRTYKVPIVFPIVVGLFFMAMVIIPLVISPQIEFLYAVLVILAGIIFYIPLVVLSKTPGCMRYVTVFFQLLMDVCPVTGIASDKKKE